MLQEIGYLLKSEKLQSLQHPLTLEELVTHDLSCLFFFYSLGPGHISWAALI